MGAVLTLQDFCEQAGLPHAAVAPLIQTLNDRQDARHAVAEANTQRRAGAPERAPLRDERGQTWGHVEATIDRESFFYWATRQDVGPECWSDDTFLREYLRDNPHARVRTVNSGGAGNRIVCNWDGNGVRERKTYTK